MDMEKYICDIEKLIAYINKSLRIYIGLFFYLLFYIGDIDKLIMS